MTRVAFPIATLKFLKITTFLGPFFVGLFLANMAFACFARPVGNALPSVWDSILGNWAALGLKAPSGERSLDPMNDIQNTHFSYDSGYIYGQFYNLPDYLRTRGYREGITVYKVLHHEQLGNGYKFYGHYYKYAYENSPLITNDFIAVLQYEGSRQQNILTIKYANDQRPNQWQYRNEASGYPSHVLLTCIDQYR